MLFDVDIDDEWRKKVVLVLAIMRLTNDNVRALDPPEVFVDRQGYLLIAAAHYDKAIDLCLESIDNVDADKLNQSIEEFGLGTAAIKQSAEVAK